MGQLEHFLKNPGSGLKILPYGRGRPGGGGSKIGKILRTSFMAP